MQDLTPILREKGLESIRRDRQNLQQRLQATASYAQKRLDNRQRLLEQSRTMMWCQTRQEYLKAPADIDGISA